jgi:hypothetical protein
MNTKRSAFHKQDLQVGKKNQAISKSNLEADVIAEPKRKQSNDCDGVCAINWKPTTVSR